MTTIKKRRAAAGDCAESLNYGVKTCIGEMDDRINKDYTAWPTRLDLIDKNRIIVHAASLGSFGFKPRELKQSIQKHLQEESAT